jgi:hypothetical protein
MGDRYDFRVEADQAAAYWAMRDPEPDCDYDFTCEECGVVSPLVDYHNTLRLCPDCAPDDE